MNFKLEHKNYIQANSNIRTGGKKNFLFANIVLEMKSGKEAKFCDGTGLGFNPCSSIHGPWDFGQVSFIFFPYLEMGVTPMI